MVRRRSSLFGGEI